MRVSVLCIGDELLKGSTVNTNLAFIGQKLLETGIIPQIAIETADRKEDILEALEFALSKAETVICSGGLGPTADDITKETIAARFGYPLVENGEVAAAISRHWHKLKRGDMPSRFLNQALVPADADILHNSCGTAPGIHMKTKPGDKFPDREIFMLPGPPPELCPMFEKQVLPVLRKKLENTIYSKLYHVVGVPESVVEDRMIPLIETAPSLSVAYCAAPEHVKLFLTSKKFETVADTAHKVREVFKGELLSDSSSSLAEEVVHLLRKHDASLSVAESCTGGLISKLMTDIPGASDVFKGGLTAYANQVKEDVLGVSESTLRTCGAVSIDCAKEMVGKVGEKFRTDAALSVTGIAGPGGGTIEKPVGLVYIGVKFRDKTFVKECHFRGGREQIRLRAAAFALNQLRRAILGLE